MNVYSGTVFVGSLAVELTLPRATLLYSCVGQTMGLQQLIVRWSRSWASVTVGLCASHHY